MFEYLRRLATTGAAYTASSVVSKLIAVFLLPIYTHYLTPSDYGAAEVMLSSVIAASIVVRFGIIEAILRFYYLAGRAPRRGWCRPASRRCSGARRSPRRSRCRSPGRSRRRCLRHEDAGLARLAILGLWTLTLYEYALTLLRLDERARAYFGITVANVLVTIPFTVWLIVVAGRAGERHPARHLRDRGPVRRLDAVARAPPALASSRTGPLLRRMFRFGLPTMPAELSLYSLNFIDRIILVRTGGPRRGGPVRARGQVRAGHAGARPRVPARLAAARLLDPRRRGGAARLLGDLHLVRRACSPSRSRACGSTSRWIVRLLAAPDFFASYQAIGLLATGHRPLRALPGDGGDPGAHGAHRVQLSGDDRRRGDERRAQPRAGAVPWASSARGWRSSPPTSWCWR